MNKILPLFALLISSVSFSQLSECSELFISEYVEGWSNNKAIEIYNPTDAAIDLSAYMIIRYSNGSTSASSGNAVQLTGMIESGDVHVGVLEKLDENGEGQEAPIWDSLQVKADAFYCPEYSVSNAWYFNGNDAVVLAKGSVNDINNSMVVDIFGKIGEDPGVAWTSEFPYTGAGLEVTKDHSMIRKAYILEGENNPVISFFDPLLEYDSIPAVVERIDENGDPVLGTSGNPILDGNWESLGSHSCDCALGNIESFNESTLSIYPNPSSGTFNLKNIENVRLIEVTDILGKSVLSKENSLSNTVITIDEKVGVYYMELTFSNEKKVIRKVVIK
ncbi:MAG: lamin tail domain-containing protein [Crocinitomicaceae bacterium]|nr:lamin tail domain-containing protein [Crocinitomicaceae bacterium]